jgi:hypothetical protein
MTIPPDYLKSIGAILTNRQNPIRRRVRLNDTNKYASILEAEFGI